MVTGRGNRRKPLHSPRYVERVKAANSVPPAIGTLILVETRLVERRVAQRERPGERAGDLGDRAPPVAQLKDDRRGVVELM